MDARPPEFVSEPIRPVGAARDTASMARGEPGLPSGFAWRGREYHVVRIEERWKASGTEGGRADGERYLRRHYYRLHVSDGSHWVVYFVRQARAGTGRQRWFLYSIEGRPDRDSG